MANQQLSKQDEYKKEVKIFENQISNYEESISQLLEQKGVSKKEFMVTVVNAVKRAPELLNCDRGSLFNAILTSAELGLMPNTPFGLSFILPYNRSVKDGNNWVKIKEAQYQTGYQGWLELMHRQPMVVQVTSEVVYEGDRFEDRKGLNPDLIHEPCRPKDRGKRLAAYAVVWLKDSPHPVWATVWAEEIDKIKDISQSANHANSPWKNEDKDPFAWQWRKTAIKQVAKMLPKTRDLHIALKTDDAVEVGDKPELTEDGAFMIIPNEEAKAEEVRQQKETKDKQTSEDAKASIIPDKKEDPKEEVKQDDGATEVIDEYIKKFNFLGYKTDILLNYYGVDHQHNMEDKDVSDMISKYESYEKGHIAKSAIYTTKKK